MTTQEVITKTISEENLKLKADMKELSNLPKQVEDLQRVMIRNGISNSFKDLVKDSLHTIDLIEWEALLKEIIKKKKQSATESK